MKRKLHTIGMVLVVSVCILLLGKRNALAQEDCTNTSTLRYYAEAEPDADGWYTWSWNGHHYKVVSSGNINWEDANAAAQGEGAHLVTISSALENAFVASLITAEHLGAADPYGSTPGPWMGGLQAEGAAEPTGGWGWVTNETFGYTNWCNGEPNNFPESQANENRMLFWNGDCWNDMRHDGNSPVAYIMELSDGDCNCNGVFDSEDVINGTSTDIDDNGVPDECFTDCNYNDLGDGYDICKGDSADINDNFIPDECEEDCNRNGVNDVEDIKFNEWADENGNLIPDLCETDCNENDVADIDEKLDQACADSNNNYVLDICETDCDGNGVMDSADLINDTLHDEDENCYPDECDLNDDGVDDDEQANVASATNSEGEVVTVTTPEGTSVHDVLVKLLSNYGDPPAGVTFSFGALEFTVRSVPSDQAFAVEVDYGFSGNETIEGYYMYGPTEDDPEPHWFDFSFDGETGAEIDGNKVTLHLKDGQPGENDLQADGVVGGVGAPVLKVAEENNDDTSSSGGGICGSAGPATCMMMVIGLMCVQYATHRRRKR